MGRKAKQTNKNQKKKAQKQRRPKASKKVVDKRTSLTLCRHTLDRIKKSRFLTEDSEARDYVISHVKRCPAYNLRNIERINYSQ